MGKHAAFQQNAEILMDRKPETKEVFNCLREVGAAVEDFGVVSL